MQRRLAPALRYAARSRQVHTDVASSTSLSHFDINTLAPLGAGAHATVYWGRHRSSEKDVAIKMMSPRVLTEKTNWVVLSRCIRKETRVFNELLTAGKMHPNVVDVISQFVSPGEEAMSAGFLLPSKAYEEPVHFFITEFLGGGSLADEILRREESGLIFQEQELLAMALAVSDGLRFLHAHGVTHRDVKPENLVYCQARKQVKLIDFSLAEVAPKEATKTALRERNIGTQGFMAPEVLIDSREGYGPSCDIFSLGCVLHRMLTGQLPHVDLDKVRVVTCLPERLTVDTRRFIESLLATNPMDRPSASEIYAICSCLAKKDLDSKGQQ